MSVGSKAIFQPRGDHDIQALVDAYPLAWIICGPPADLAATPMPVQIRCDDAGHPNMLVGHFARSNPQVKQLAMTPDALVLLMGPHAYVSPSWFDDRTQAPTWNYACAAFHVHVELDEEPDVIGQRLDDLVEAMEASHAQPWHSSEMGPRYASLSRGVVGFHAKILGMSASFKLGQDERDDVFADILAGLQASGANEIVAWMDRFAGSTRLTSISGMRAASRAPQRVAGTIPAADHASLEPALERFVKSVNDDTRRLSRARELDWPTRRLIAEQVRNPWTKDGPPMKLTREFEVVTESGVLRVRLHDPSGDAVKPVLIYLHGGGWSMFSMDTHDRLMREYAKSADVAVLGVDYALAPEHKYPYALNQIDSVLNWLRTHASTLGIDPARIAIGGDSAGANLALATALRQRDGGSAAGIAGLLLNYGGFDVEVDAESRRRFGTPADMLTASEIDMFWSNYLRGDADRLDPLACPLKAELAGLPPTLLVVPECDVLAAQSVAMHERMRKAGLDVQCAIYPHAMHSFLEAMSISSLAMRAIDESSTWLRRHLHGKSIA